ncbi:MAG TPA: SET domain-containing protein-lysine N-methyltransferase [Polyangiaceae bacterium]
MSGAVMQDSPPVVVRRSRVQGKGVFATRAIAEGERIIEYTGALITNEEADSMADDEGMRRHHTFLFGVDDVYTVDGGQGGNEARFINHSCDPSCESVIVRRRVYIHAVRDIEEGEELTYDYWYTTDDGYTLEDLRRIYPCRCRSANCRGTLARPPRRKRKAG